MRFRHQMSQLVSLSPPAGRKARVGRKSKGWLVLEALEVRSVPTVSILNGGGAGYVGNGGGAPPDVTGAAGPSSYIESNNTTFTIFNKSAGTQIASQTADQFFFGTAAGDGGLTQVTPTSQRIADVTMVFDNLMGGTGRFILGDLDADLTNNQSQYVFAVSTSNNPKSLTKFDPVTSTGDWRFYQITTTEGSGGASSQSWSDYPGNPGYNADAFVETFNMFGGGPTGTQVVSVKASDLAAGNALVTSGAGQNVFRNDVPGGAQNYRPTTMADAAAGAPMWLIHNPGDGTTLDVVKMTGVLSTGPAFSTTSLSLGANSFLGSGSIANPLNPDDTAAIDGDDDSGDFSENPGGGGAFDPGSRILKAAEQNNVIVAAHTVAVASGQPSTLASAQPNDKNGKFQGGSGYKVGDIVTVTGGTSTTAAQLKVQSVNGSGGITSATVNNAGSYSSLSGISGGVSGGSGSGAVFSLFFTGELAAQWYAIDVSGSTPAFQKVGGVDNVGRMAFGANTYAYEPAIDINSSGEIGLGFMESDTTGGAVNPATGGFISTFVTARKASDPAGTMDAPVLVSAGPGSAPITGRIGDFSGLNVDPSNNTFWHVNEFGGAGGPTVIANFTPEDRPVVTAPSDQTSVEGASTSFNLGSFVDADGSPWTVRVSWGDGSPDTVFTTSSAGSLGTQSHTYAEEGNDVVTVTVTDSTTLSDSKSFNVNVKDPAVAAKGGFVVKSFEGADSGTQPVATFTDPGGTDEPIGNYAATIDWGDGSPTTVGTISYAGGVYTVTGNHTYKEESGPEHTGPNGYDVSVTISHESAPKAVALSSAIVTDLSVAGTGGFTVNALECQAVANIPVATFTDPGGPEALGDYSATIKWGDGHTSPGVISGPVNGVYTVSGGNTFEEDGTYTVTVTLHHESSSDVSVTDTVIVHDNIGILLLDPTGSGALTATGNASVTVSDVNDCGAIVINSNSPSAGVANGNAVVSSGEYDITGVPGTRTSGHGAFVYHEEMNTGEAPTADPLAGVLPPTPSTTPFSAVNDTGGPLLTLLPGTYKGGIHVSGKGSIFLKPGVYYMEGGGFSVSGQGSVAGDGVTIYNAPASKSDGFSFSGQATVNLSGPTSGPFESLVFFQAPTSADTFQVSGNAVLNLSGIVYAADATLMVSGNGEILDAGNAAQTVSAAIDALDLSVSGNGVVDIDVSNNSPQGLHFGATDTAPAVAGAAGIPGNSPAAPAGAIITLADEPARLSPLVIDPAALGDAAVDVAHSQVNAPVALKVVPQSLPKTPVADSDSLSS